MTDRQLLISLHQKIDRNHDWAKHQVGEILSYLAQTHTSQKKAHQYVHHTYLHLDALMKEVLIPEDLKHLSLHKPPLQAIRPPCQFRRCNTPPMAAESYSSDQEFSFGEAEDTAACPHTATACLRHDSPRP